jgi:hypothetical protein
MDNEGDPFYAWPIRGNDQCWVYVTSLPAEDDIKWTLFRVGGLTNGEKRPVEATFLGTGKDGMWISRASVAEWVMEEAIQEKWVRRIPYICN